MRSTEFVREKLQRTSSGELVIFDIDDTLFHTTAMIDVVDKETGRVVQSLTNQQFNNYKLKPGEEFDFKQFRDAKKFRDESVPIDPMLDQLKQDLSSGKNVVMLTARSDFNNQPLVWEKFKEHGIDINKDVHLFRAGNAPGNDPPAIKKQIHVRDWLSSGKFSSVTMYDDSNSNLTAFKALQKEFPQVQFSAHHVSPEGQTKQIEEGVDPEQKETFIEIFSKFLPVAVKTLGLKSLPKFEFLDNLNHSEQPSFGMYVNEEDTMYVALANRHPNDILRTLAHELVHYKQDVEHQLNPDSGVTGSPEENEANAMAGVVMRHFNKMYPEYLKVKPLVLERKKKKVKHAAYGPGPYGLYGTDIGYSGDGGVGENFADGRNPQDKGDSKRYKVPTKGKISTLRKIAKQGGRRGQLAHWMANMRSGKAKKK